MGAEQSHHGHSHGADGACDDGGNSHGHSHAHGGGHSHAHGPAAHVHPSTPHMVLHVAGGHALLGARFPEGAAPQLELVIMDDLPIVQESFPTRITNPRGETTAVVLRKAPANSTGGTRFTADAATIKLEEPLTLAMSIIIDGHEADITFENFQPSRFVVA